MLGFLRNEWSCVQRAEVTPLNQVYSSFNTMLALNVVDTVRFRSWSPSASSSRRSRAEQWKRPSHGKSSARCAGKRGMLLVLTVVLICTVSFSFFGALPAAASESVQLGLPYAEGSGPGSSPSEDVAAAARVPGERVTATGAQEAHNITTIPEHEAPKKHSPEVTYREAVENGAVDEPALEGVPMYGSQRVYDVTGSGGAREGEKVESTLWTDSGERKHLRGGVPSSWMPGREEDGATQEGEKEEEEEEEAEEQEDALIDAEGDVKEGHIEEQKGEEEVGEKEGETPRVESDEEEEREGVDEANKESAEETSVIGGSDSLFNKELETLINSISTDHTQPLYSRSLCALADSPLCAGDSRKKEKPVPDISHLAQQTKALISSMLRILLLDLKIPYSPFWSREHPVLVHQSGGCRLTFTMDRLVPTDEIRLYVAPSERRVGLAAERKVKRSEEGKAYSRMYDAETRLHAVASIAEGCMVSEKLVKAGLIGWSYAGKTEDSIKILVTFPSEAHTKALVERKQVSEEAYKKLVDGEGLEQLTPSEKCLLSGRTETDCDRLKAEAGEKHESALIFSTQGYAENEIRLPEFRYV